MNKVCEFCNGTGQISYFKGVSRFLLSSDECPECAGLGFVFTPDPEEAPTDEDGESPGGSDSTS